VVQTETGREVFHADEVLTFESGCMDRPVVEPGRTLHASHKALQRQPVQESSIHFSPFLQFGKFRSHRGHTCLSMTARGESPIFMDLKDWYHLGSTITQENVSRKLQLVIYQEKLPYKFKEYK
jgi:hypothetical protein